MFSSRRGSVGLGAVFAGVRATRQVNGQSGVLAQLVLDGAKQREFGGRLTVMGDETKIDDEIPVSGTDELTVAGGPDADRTRKLGEFDPTNAPLSAAEIEKRKALLKKKRGDEEWVPRTTDIIDETRP